MFCSRSTTEKGTCDLDLEVRRESRWAQIFSAEGRQVKFSKCKYAGSFEKGQGIQ